MAEAARAFMMTFFLTHGYTDYQANAMVRHAQIESGLDHCIVVPGGAYLYQWVGARRRALRAFAGTAGCPSLETQLRFADHELRTEPSYRRFWSAAPRNAFAVLRECFGWGRC